MKPSTERGPLGAWLKNTQYRQFSMGLIFSVGAAALAINCGANGAGRTPTGASVVPSRTLQVAAADGRPTILAPGYALPLKAMVTSADGPSADVTRSAVWQSSNPAAATVSPEGVVSAFADGAVEISATFEGISARIHVDIRRTCEAATSLLSAVDPKTGKPTGYVTEDTLSAFYNFKWVQLTVATSDCRSTMSSDADWLYVPNGDPGVSGNQSVAYSVSENYVPGPRVGHISISFPSGPSLVYTVTQERPVCSYIVTPTKVSFGPSGGGGEFNLSVTPASCNWVLKPPTRRSAIQLTSPTAGAGSAKISYRVDGSIPGQHEVWIGDDVDLSSPANYFTVIVGR